ncbi:hypothetical protein B0T14DRAFT_309009 [Immersiella caudata]|uniref:Uncharacterized protein n=1 Tax=Immersiella caudata TaxID=314043 RepID=A0AA39WFH1_9PEZI|nr:hypothetical protein B0T14DRAFT_309009 [Immersiella caudata]
MLGKVLLTIDAIGLLLGAPIADMSHSHIYNPRWPPHAKFHCGQTITLSVALGLATLFFTWRSSFLAPSTPAAVAARVARDSLHTAVVVGTIYWLAGLIAVTYPGSAGSDPEFGTGFPQAPVFSAFTTVAVTGWAYETWMR